MLGLSTDDASKGREGTWRQKSRNTASAAQIEKFRTAGMLENPPRANATTSASARRQGCITLNASLQPLSKSYSTPFMGPRTSLIC